MVSRVSDIVVDSVEDVRSAVRSCVADGHGLIPYGGGRRQHVGHAPSRPVQKLSTTGLNSIIDYNPQDLVVVAEAGVTFAHLSAELLKAGQWLPIDVAAPDQQTLGGIVASKANSSLRAGYGSVRDWLIGVEVVNSGAEVVVGGGKVVKNVAGYDLSRLYCGSWGTLGVLTKTNFKVLPLPENSRCLLIVLSKDRNAEDLLDRMIATINPATATLFNAHAAASILGEDADQSQYLFLKVLGLTEDVESSIESAASAAAPFAASIITIPEPVASKLSRQLTDFSLKDALLTAEYHVLSSQVGAHVRMIDWIAERHGLFAEVVADTVCGIVTAHFYEQDDEIDWAAFLPLFKDKANRVGGSLIVERMPQSWRDTGFPVWSPILDDFRLMLLIKQKLDPANIFNPGRFMGGL